MALTSVYDEQSYKDMLRTTWADMGCSKSPTSLFSPDSPALGTLPRDHLVAHIDGKHTVVVFVWDSHFYPRFDAWVYVDRLLKPSDVAFAQKTPHGRLSKQWELEVPSGWQYHVGKTGEERYLIR